MKVSGEVAHHVNGQYSSMVKYNPSPIARKKLYSVTLAIRYFDFPAPKRAYQCIDQVAKGCGDFMVLLFTFMLVDTAF